MTNDFPSDAPDSGDESFPMVARRNPIARRRRLRHELAVRGALSVAELSTILGASSNTIRRDLEVLAREGIAERGYGGAAPRALRPAEEELAIREQRDAEEKRAIARIAVRLVKSGDTIFLNDGSTVMALARELSAAELELFVITPAVNVANVLVENPRLTVCLLGGFVRRSSLATGGAFAETMLEQFNADIALMSADSFGVEAGLSYSNTDDAMLSRKMAAHARHCVAMISSSKFSRTARLTGIRTGDVDTLVTAALPEEMRVPLAERGVRVMEAAGERDV
jgi:DeoR/GlpR family transcriptional regulator of sugar metabolism